MIRVPRPVSLPAATDRLVVVEASAGTGKTYFLEHRVVDLILGGAELGQILLVTFTEKAVAELRMRIRDVLDRLARHTGDDAGESHWVVDDAARARLRAAVTAFDHAPIFTIHGFCHRILVEDAFASQRLFQQTQVADEVAFDAAFGALLREQFARALPDRELLEAFLASGRSVDRLRNLLLSCARIGIDARMRRRFDPEAVRIAADDFREHFGTESRRNIIVAALLSERKWLTGRLEQIATALDETPADAPAAQLLAMLDRCREAVELIAGRANKLTSGIVAAAKGLLSTMSLDEAIASTMLPSILARVQSDKQEHGHFDYDDMLHLVWRALTGSRGKELAARLRERTPWAMIDEFQDTDPVQWNIFRTVWMHDDARGLTIVGDPKQAIYSFRGADVKTYLEARDEMLRGGATRVPLDVNRRSTESLVAAVNQILVGNIMMPLLAGDITYDEPVKASGDVLCSDTRPPIAVLAIKAGSKANADGNRIALARGIGDAIEALRERPPSWSSRGAIKPFALGQVMVLTRTNRDSTEIAAALRARGLPCALVEAEKLFATREAAELAAVLAAIAEPRDRSARLRALRTRFFDVPWADLMQVVDAPDHHPLIARIFDWAQLASKRAYETLFRRVVEDSRFAERALVLGGGERAVTNTWHLIELLLAELARARSDLHELVGRLRRWMLDESSHPDERDVQRAETDADAVRILTIHKAKGLEAPYVFLYGGLAGGPKGTVRSLRDAVGRLIIVGDHDDTTRAQIEAEIDGENQRLAYVALTRAQVRLYLPLYADLKRDATYQPIQRCVAPLIGRPASTRVLFETIEIPLDTPELAEPPADALAKFVAPSLPSLSEVAPLPPERAGLVMLSYTRLAHDLELPMTTAKPGDALAIDPAEFDVDDASGTADAAPLVGPDDLPPGADSGLLLHDVLEVADLAVARRAADVAQWAADPEVERQLADAARGRGIDARFLPHARQLLHRTLTQPLALTDGNTLPPLIAAPAFAREVEFSYPLDMIDAASSAASMRNRGFVRGFIDALVAWDDELWVLDYKSDVLAGADLAAAARHRVEEHYAVQARLYAIAADRLRGRRRLAGMLFTFMRHDLVVPWRIEDGTLDAWRDWLARIARRPFADQHAPPSRPEVRL
ncbi:MAG: UvrD-helicase domain-containing protein [Myxococcota bacterium]|nr:UvrD-helicase domain-containing protein [Myxococcota bacterium]